jgi:RNA polymerase sigma factor (sigma-70 family)
LKKISTPYNARHRAPPLCVVISEKRPLHNAQNVTEHQLIQACIAQDRHAQRLLYERYKRAMYTLACRMMSDREVAAEVLQDAFLQVFRHIGDFQGRSTLGAWIKTIVARTALTQLRKKRLLTEPLDFRSESDPLDWGHAPLDTEYLERAIQRLPEGYRAVFVLAEVEGFSHREIGDLLGISEGTSKSQLFYAKKRLRETLTLA